MKILLAAVNARFNHTNIAVRSLTRYSDSPDIVFDEWTINMSHGEILRGIAGHNPDILLFSTYIWNAETIRRLICDVKKICPNIIIGAGGPEAGFFAEGYLKKLPDLDFIISGEGEETVKELCHNFSDMESLKNIKGIWYRNNDIPVFSGERELICNLDDIPFPYSKEELKQKDTKIFYYESSRGCPFSCSYCMSSLDKRVRFRSLEKVFTHLQLFLDAEVSLVKFVDRTYNLNEERYIKIWQYILDNHNHKTMFHFEIEAEFLSKKALDFIQQVPPGIMQFEIGVQSSNPLTLKESGRSSQTAALEENIKKIPSSIHKHLDLIAGLPFENLNSFGKSYDFVMSLNPDALQLGFLKILHGTSMEKYAFDNNYKWMAEPPYEIFSTPWLSYADILFLKDVEILTDSYFNSGIFKSSMAYIKRKMNPWTFVSKMAERARKSGALDAARKPLYWFDFIAKFFSDDPIFMELLKFDYLSIGKTSVFPEWLNHIYDKEKHLTAMTEYEEKNKIRVQFKSSEYDEFNLNPLSEIPEDERIKTNILFNYASSSASCV